MLIVDPSKVENYRDLVDEAIVETALENNCDRQLAYYDLLAMDFQTSLEMIKCRNGWWSSLAIENLGYYSFQGPAERVAQHHCDANVAAEWVLDSLVLAREPETLAIATILLLIDEAIDIAMTFEKFRIYYGESSLADIVDAVACQHCATRDWSQYLLFPQSYDERLSGAWLKIAGSLRPMVLEWTDRYARASGQGITT